MKNSTLLFAPVMIFLLFSLTSFQVSGADYTTYPPYANQATDPASGSCVTICFYDWSRRIPQIVGSGTKCAYGNKDYGDAWMAASASSDPPGGGVSSLVEFNKNPVPGNSPVIRTDKPFTTSSLQDWFGEVYNEGSSEAYIEFRLEAWYRRCCPLEWRYADRREAYWSATYNGDALPFDFYGRLAWTISLPRGDQIYAIVSRSYSMATAYRGNAYADFFWGAYYTMTLYLRISG